MQVNICGFGNSHHKMLSAVEFCAQLCLFVHFLISPYHLQLTSWTCLENNSLNLMLKPLFM